MAAATRSFPFIPSLTLLLFFVASTSHSHPIRPQLTTLHIIISLHIVQFSIDHRNFTADPLAMASMDPYSGQTATPAHTNPRYIKAGSKLEIYVTALNNMVSDEDPVTFTQWTIQVKSHRDITAAIRDRCAKIALYIDMNANATGDLDSTIDEWCEELDEWAKEGLLKTWMHFLHDTDASYGGFHIPTDSQLTKLSKRQPFDEETNPEEHQYQYDTTKFLIPIVRHLNIELGKLPFFKPWTIHTDEVYTQTVALVESIRLSAADYAAFGYSMQDVTETIKLCQDLKAYWVWCQVLHEHLPQTFDQKPDAIELAKQLVSMRQSKAELSRDVAWNTFAPFFDRLRELRVGSTRPSYMDDYTLEQLLEAFVKHTWESANDDVVTHKAIIESHENMLQGWCEAGNVQEWMRDLKSKLPRSPPLLSDLNNGNGKVDHNCVDKEAQDMYYNLPDDDDPEFNDIPDGHDDDAENDSNHGSPKEDEEMEGIVRDAEGDAEEQNRNSYCPRDDVSEESVFDHGSKDASNPENDNDFDALDLDDDSLFGDQDDDLNNDSQHDNQDFRLDFDTQSQLDQIASPLHGNDNAAAWSKYSFDHMHPNRFRHLINEDTYQDALTKWKVIATIENNIQWHQAVNKYEAEYTQFHAAALAETMQPQVLSSRVVDSGVKSGEPTANQQLLPGPPSTDSTPRKIAPLRKRLMQSPLFGLTFGRITPKKVTPEQVTPKKGTHEPDTLMVDTMEPVASEQGTPGPDTLMINTSKPVGSKSAEVSLFRCSELLWATSTSDAKVNSFVSPTSTVLPESQPTAASTTNTAITPRIDFGLFDLNNSMFGNGSLSNPEQTPSDPLSQSWVLPDLTSQPSNGLLTSQPSKDFDFSGAFGSTINAFKFVTPKNDRGASVSTLSKSGGFDVSKASGDGDLYTFVTSRPIGGGNLVGLDTSMIDHDASVSTPPTGGLDFSKACAGSGNPFKFDTSKTSGFGGNPFTFDTSKNDPGASVMTTPFNGSHPEAILMSDRGRSEPSITSDSGGSSNLPTSSSDDGGIFEKLSSVSNNNLSLMPSGSGCARFDFDTPANAIKASYSAVEPTIPVGPQPDPDLKKIISMALGGQDSTQAQKARQDPSKFNTLNVGQLGVYGNEPNEKTASFPVAPTSSTKSSTEDPKIPLVVGAQTPEQSGVNSSNSKPTEKKDFFFAPQKLVLGQNERGKLDFVLRKNEVASELGRWSSRAIGATALETLSAATFSSGEQANVSLSRPIPAQRQLPQFSVASLPDPCKRVMVFQSVEKAASAPFSRFSTAVDNASLSPFHNLVKVPRFTPKEKSASSVSCTSPSDNGNRPDNHQPTLVPEPAKEEMTSSFSKLKVGPSTNNAIEKTTSAAPPSTVPKSLSTLGSSCTLNTKAVNALETRLEESRSKLETPLSAKEASFSTNLEGSLPVCKKKLVGRNHRYQETKKAQEFQTQAAEKNEPASPRIAGQTSVLGGHSVVEHAEESSQAEEPCATEHTDALSQDAANQAGVYDAETGNGAAPTSALATSFGSSDASPPLLRKTNQLLGYSSDMKAFRDQMLLELKDLRSQQFVQQEQATAAQKCMQEKLDAMEEKHKQEMNNLSERHRKEVDASNEKHEKQLQENNELLHILSEQFSELRGECRVQAEELRLTKRQLSNLRKSMKKKAKPQPAESDHVASEAALEPVAKKCFEPVRMVEKSASAGGSEEIVPAVKDVPGRAELEVLPDNLPELAAQIVEESSTAKSTDQHYSVADTPTVANSKPLPSAQSELPAHNEEKSHLVKRQGNAANQAELESFQTQHREAQQAPKNGNTGDHQIDDTSSLEDNYPPHYPSRKRGIGFLYFDEVEDSNDWEKKELREEEGKTVNVVFEQKERELLRALTTEQQFPVAEEDLAVSEPEPVPAEKLEETALVDNTKQHSFLTKDIEPATVSRPASFFTRGRLVNNAVSRQDWRRPGQPRHRADAEDRHRSLNWPIQNEGRRRMPSLSLYPPCPFYKEKYDMDDFLEQFQSMGEDPFYNVINDKIQTLNIGPIHHPAKVRNVARAIVSIVVFVHKAVKRENSDFAEPLHQELVLKCYDLVNEGAGPWWNQEDLYNLADTVALVQSTIEAADQVHEHILKPDSPITTQLQTYRHHIEREKHHRRREEESRGWFEAFFSALRGPGADAIQAKYHATQCAEIRGTLACATLNQAATARKAYGEEILELLSHGDLSFTLKKLIQKKAEEQWRKMRVKMEEACEEFGVVGIFEELVQDRVLGWRKLGEDIEDEIEWVCLPTTSSP